MENKETQLAPAYDFLKDYQSVGMEDFSEEDVLIPTLTVVQPNNKNIQLPRGQLAIGDKASTKITVSFFGFVKKNLKDAKSDELIRNHIFIGMTETGTLFRMYVNKTSLYEARKFENLVLRTQKMAQRNKQIAPPMFCFKIELSTEQKTNEKGTWFVPVFNHIGFYQDQEQLKKFAEMAKKYLPILREQGEEGDLDSDLQIHTSVTEPDPNDPSLSEDVNPDDVPF